MKQAIKQWIDPITVSEEIRRMQAEYESEQLFSLCYKAEQLTSGGKMEHFGKKYTKMKNRP